MNRNGKYLPNRTKARHFFQGLPLAIDDLYIHLIVPFIELDLQDTGCWVREHQDFGTAIILQLLNITVIDLSCNVFYF